jgi:hypothetical protein
MDNYDYLFIASQHLAVCLRGILENEKHVSQSSTDTPPNVTIECEYNYEPSDYLDVKIYLVALCGTVLAVTSVCENLLLLYMFITRSKFRASNIFYMMFLAFCDIFVSASYIFLMSLYVISEYFEVVNHIFQMSINSSLDCYTVYNVARLSATNLCNISRCHGRQFISYYDCNI